jgi:hypothetical protein
MCRHEGQTLGRRRNCLGLNQAEAIPRTPMS